ncbi:GPCR fungal pheromone mating factor, partial [Mycena amicta]
MVSARWLMAWIVLSCLNESLNMALWAETDEINGFSAGFCEVSTRIRMAACIGIPAAGFVISRKIYSYISAEVDNRPRAYESKILRNKAVDSLICGIFVAVYILLELIDSLQTQRRFAILEGVGC